MAKTYNKMQIDMNGEIHSSVTAVAQDTLSRYLDCYLFNNGVPIDLDGHMVQLYVNKPDKTTVVTQGEITDAANGRVQFELTNQTLAVPGCLELQIVLFSGDTEVLSSHTFKLFVISSLRDDEAVESTNEFGALVVLFQDIQNALNLMDKMVSMFGEPSNKAADLGASTFWQMLEELAARADAREIVKTNINSTMDTDRFLPIDRMISSESGREGFLPLNELIENVVRGGSQTFTTDGVFTVPAGITLIKVTAAGGGGGGGAGDEEGNYEASGGGGGACIYKQMFEVVPLSKINITIGKGGLGAQTNQYGAKVTAGNPGTATVVGDLVTLPGGGGAPGVSAQTIAGGEAGGPGGGKGGNGGYSKNVTKGEDGIVGRGGNIVDDGNGHTYGAGGGGSYGDGGTSKKSGSGNGVHGGGGSGGDYNSRGGNGGDGIVIIEWGLAST